MNSEGSEQIYGDLPAQDTTFFRVGQLFQMLSISAKTHAKRTQRSITTKFTVPWHDRIDTV